ncbi:hypothetical protein Acor_24500 [Acrocarpospora corrugata]|uniref:Uncharacterized protein n=1 Tax=Acrocarpospora corrugata TaxID=35763 RepID=A0A5M3VUY7_9ACTN|nr:hypothetical protein [Acrocarpospora corrugata]GES00386.1 hypothetical protein Acor_24500 [Acrocarpospora corrugata]
MDVEVRGSDQEEAPVPDVSLREVRENDAISKKKLFHRHEWLEIERIGNVVTSQCLCGQSKTRVN